MRRLDMDLLIPRRKRHVIPEPQCTFTEALRSTARFPIRGRGPYLLAGWGLALMVLELIGLLGPPAVFPVYLVLGLLLAAFMAETVTSAASGDSDAPEFPGLAPETVLRPAWLLIVAAVISASPTIAAAALLFVGEWATWLFLPALAAGIFYLPMAILGTIMFNMPEGALPHRVLPAIRRVLKPYCWMCLGLAAGILPTLIVGAVLVVRLFGPLGLSWPPLFALLGPFTMIYFKMTAYSLVLTYPVIVLAGIAWLYITMVQMRIIGLLYFHHERQIGWFYLGPRRPTAGTAAPPAEDDD